MATVDPALASCRLMVATPMYDGAQGSYVRSALALGLAAQAQGLDIRFEFILYQPSLTRARNMLSNIFLNGDYTHMLFLDSDMGFEPEDVFSLVRAMAADPECAVLGGPAPRRLISWHQVAQAAERGLAKDNPADLARFAGDFAVSFLNPNQSFALNKLVELARLGTGMMLIRRDVLERLRETHPDLSYRPDADDLRNYRIGDRIHAFFMPMIEPETHFLLSDDYAFCRRVRDAGFRIWLAPWVRLTHSGPAIFDGSIADLAPLFAAPAAVSSPE